MCVSRSVRARVSVGRGLQRRRPSSAAAIRASRSCARRARSATRTTLGVRGRSVRGTISCPSGQVCRPARASRPISSTPTPAARAQHVTTGGGGCAAGGGGGTLGLCRARLLVPRRRRRVTDPSGPRRPQRGPVSPIPRAAASAAREARRDRAILRALLIAVLAAAGAACNVNQYCLNCETDDGGGKDSMMPPTPRSTAASSATAACRRRRGLRRRRQRLRRQGRRHDADPLPQVGDACGQNVGECTAGTVSCTTGKLGVQRRRAERRDLRRQGQRLRRRRRRRRSGRRRRSAAATPATASRASRCARPAACSARATIGPQPEMCDGRTTTATAMIDEDIPARRPRAARPQRQHGRVHARHVDVPAAAARCASATVIPTFETCDGADNDCDGVIDNGFNLQTDVQNCGMCGNVVHGRQRHAEVRDGRVRGSARARRASSISTTIRRTAASTRATSRAPTRSATASTTTATA